MAAEIGMDERDWGLLGLAGAGDFPPARVLTRVVAGKRRQYRNTADSVRDRLAPMRKPQTSKSPTSTDLHVGKRVCMRRKMLSMSQTDLGNALGLTFQQVQKYERGANRIGAGRLQQMAHTLRVPISFFFDDPMKPNEGGNGKQTRSPDFVSDFLTTTHGLALTRAFMLIKDTKLRRSIVKLVEDLVGEND